MDRQSFTDLIQTKFKMVRIEAGYTQDTMAQTIGLSKKHWFKLKRKSSTKLDYMRINLCFIQRFRCIK